MYIMGYTYDMLADRDDPSNIQKHFQDELLALWPVLKGSLAEVRKPCIRQNCTACARGDKHAAFIWSFTEKGRRRCMYVPAPMVPLLRQGLENGRKLDALLTQLGPMLLRQHRQERTAPSRR
jgi:hypothetical protein